MLARGGSLSITFCSSGPEAKNKNIDDRGAERADDAVEGKPDDVRARSPAHGSDSEAERTLKRQRLAV